MRHAESSGQDSDAPLTSAGAAQAAALAPVLAALEVGPLFASPMRRAMDTLGPFARHSGQEITAIDALRERTLAPNKLTDWKVHIERSFGDAQYKLAGGESHADLLVRWQEALASVAVAGGRPTFVTHGGMTAALFHDLDPGFGFDGWATLRNPDLFEITLDGTKLTAFHRINLKEP
ncbi:MAG: histidine phosphatase family protein [Pseudomonadota bacterium]